MRKDRVIVTLLVVLAIVSAAAVYFTLRPVNCGNYECFQNHMANCARTSYVNEEPEASWKYDIIRRDRKTCEIQVTLLQAKKGDLELENFKGHTMLCNYPIGVIAYPDKDMSLCHGLLKEDLQGLLIEKLHQYVIDNLDQIKEGLNSSNTVS